MDIIVIGGGASGLASAINAKCEKNNVTILEKNKVCGKKISITGNGKCNFLNDNFKIEKYNSQNIKFLNNYITEENKEKVLKMIKNIGVESYQKDGYYYPLSNQAITVSNALIKEAVVNKINIEYETEVLDINKLDKFEIITNKKTYYADKVVIATGSGAGIKSSNNNLINVLKKLGHNIVPLTPSLVQLEAKNPYKDLAGVRTNAVLTLKEKNKIIKTTKGELQFTDYGISGICTFNLSGLVSRGLLNKQTEEIFIDLIPTIPNFINYMNEVGSHLKNRTITDIMDGLLNYKIVNQILKITKIKTDEYWTNLEKIKKQELENNLKQFKLQIINTKGFDFAQVSSGGVSLEDINNNFESKIVPNLYIVGEALDVDGECGGYNLSFAFISGMISGINIRG